MVQNGARQELARKGAEASGAPSGNPRRVRRPRLTPGVLALALLGATLASGCAHKQLAVGGEETGLASFYGPGFEGRKTASGVVFDSSQMTCAHRTLPFGTRVKVTDLDTGRSVVVTVTDRGPFVRGRVIDLSMGAARELGMLDRGVARVRVDRIR